MDWILLVLAGFGEVLGVIGINKINTRKSLGAYVWMAGGFLLSFLFLTLAMRTISMGTAYAVWTGIGTAGSAIAGMLLYGESREWRRLLFIAFILGAAMGLKLISE
ncbi:MULTISPECIES: DMT family transporter [Paenibacillus]|jgi:paired small multidrug resistance pump|uniref:Paired small multidrug resistance pump n=1 Tax=Paenibacillus barengoltzii J12 TaxID=935846 RepID=A0ABY1M0L6_9BACL|nr:MULTISPECIES: multidrug efflux SMR transporter [Paenibacillus]MDU0332757.1 multidrug efflux SMR transporter [Paenibacillus sp. 3LSP]MEC2344476.1 multidrug efflux SMR transporter [Paenibacillus barengoltzii]SMF27874.1 paired small multidrug resistance pump [Paenibacillus barengoltzii J12]SMF29389.1 paired small multidrug resistance pump [Paenibacillus barengoltzii]